jgi:hypothetical protein
LVQLIQITVLRLKEKEVIYIETSMNKMSTANMQGQKRWKRFKLAQENHALYI